MDAFKIYNIKTLTYLTLSPRFCTHKALVCRIHFCLFTHHFC